GEFPRMSVLVTFVGETAHNIPDASAPVIAVLFTIVRLNMVILPVSPALAREMPPHEAPEPPLSCTRRLVNAKSVALSSAAPALLPVKMSASNVITHFCVVDKPTPDPFLMVDRVMVSRVPP